MVFKLWFSRGGSSITLSLKAGYGEDACRTKIDKKLIAETDALPRPRHPPPNPPHNITVDQNLVVKSAVVRVVRCKMKRNV